MMTIVEAAETVVHMSLFDLSVKLPSASMANQQPKASDEFVDSVFDTRCGELDDDGIPPALIELTKTVTHATNETHIRCNMRRAVQFQFTPDYVDKLFALNELVQGTLYTTKSNATTTSNGLRPIVRYNNIKELSKLLGTANAIEWNVEKISVQFMTSMDRLLNLAIFKWNGKIAVQMHPEQMTVATTCDTLVINTQNSMLLHPASVHFDCNLSQEKWSKKLLIAANVTSNGVHFSIDPTDFWTSAKVQLDFWACFNRNFKWSEQTANKQTSNVAGETPEVAANRLPYELPSTVTSSGQNTEEYFQDDLRCVLFDFKRSI